MLHIFEIKIPNRTKFGGVFQEEFILPTKIGKINGICANIVLDNRSRLKKENDLERTLQLGTVAVSLNNTDVISASVRSVVLAKQPINSLAKNMTRFEPIAITSGSNMRIIFEEVLFSPFVKANDPQVADYFQQDETPTNGYTLKVYVNYTKK